MTTFTRVKIALVFTVISFTTLSSMAGVVSASNNRALSVESEPILLLDGTYGEFDGDSEIDDFTVRILFDFTSWDLDKSVRISMTMIVTLPSGLKYVFSIDVWTVAKDDHILQIFCYNGATESGWYEVDLHGTVRGLNAIIAIEDNMIFDPPTPKGSGEPTVDALWV